MHDTPATLHAHAREQGGVFTRKQAVQAGATERQVKTALGPRGAWVVVRRGVYAERATWDAADDAARHLMRVRAAVLNAEEPHVLSHTSAAVVHGLDCRPHWRELVHLSHPGVRGGRTEGGVKHHPADVPPHQVVTVEGLRVTDLARTGVDVAREHGVEDGVVALDQVLRRGVRRGAVRQVLEGMRYWPHVTRARAALELADPGAANPGESLARMLVVELGVGRPQTQVVVEDEQRRAQVDLLLEGHVFEFDGRQKFVGRSRGGWAPESVEDALWDEKQREDWLRSLGFGVSRIVWADLFGTRRVETITRLRREFEVTQRWRHEAGAGAARGRRTA